MTVQRTIPMLADPRPRPQFVSRVRVPCAPERPDDAPSSGHAPPLAVAEWLVEEGLRRLAAPGRAVE